jgi:hypothetical protein
MTGPSRRSERGKNRSIVRDANKHPGEIRGTGILKSGCPNAAPMLLGMNHHGVEETEAQGVPAEGADAGVSDQRDLSGEPQQR